MIPRYQRVVYWILVVGILVLGFMLIRGCERNQQRIAAMRDQSPIAAPSDTPSEQVQVALANDADGSIRLDSVSLPMPEEPSMRARALLDRILTDDAASGATHSVPQGPAVTDVFLVPLPIVARDTSNATSSVGLSTGDYPQSQLKIDPPHSAYGLYHAPGAQLAVVNLTKTFADAHPSSVESEDLTLRQIIATLHANLPQVEEVRFLVDGQTRDTLAGHADLTRPYSIQDPAKAIHALSPDGIPE